MAVTCEEVDLNRVNRSEPNKEVETRPIIATNHSNGQMLVEAELEAKLTRRFNDLMESNSIEGLTLSQDDLLDQKAISKLLLNLNILVASNGVAKEGQHGHGRGQIGVDSIDNCYTQSSTNAEVHLEYI